MVPGSRLPPDQRLSVPTGSSLTRWERAYAAFESPRQESRKFARRLRSIGAGAWDKTSTVLEVCCGRGSGLRAWDALGFQRVLGLDSSRALVSAYRGPGRCLLGDVRAIPLSSGSCRVVVVQGGLHHLATSADVAAALAEMTRVVSPDGRIAVVEPWVTHFLVVVHALCRRRVLRRLFRRVDALATMIEEETQTYERWLNAPDDNLSLLLRFIEPEILRRRRGKLILVGAPRKWRGTT